MQVSHGDQSVLQMSDVASKTLQVMSEIERRSLCFSKHLEVYREHGIIDFTHLKDLCQQMSLGGVSQARGNSPWTK